jgi:hypothetical protein
VYRLSQNAHTNEHSAELVGQLTQQMHQAASPLPHTAAP